YFSDQTTSSIIDANNVERNIIFQDQSLHKLSAVVGGLYAGLNVDVNNGFVFGLDTNIDWSGAKDTKVIDISDFLQFD
ncbi:MAG: hemin-binding protein E, partial [Bartonella sp.]|nr:hemin-binding protein E [Bartonella sp.]